jgi:hypothetical protein
MDQLAQNLQHYCKMTWKPFQEDYSIMQFAVLHVLEAKRPWKRSALNAERSPTKPVPKYPALTTWRHVRRCHCTRSHLVTVENRWNQNAALWGASNHFWKHSKLLISSKHTPLATHSPSKHSSFLIIALILSVRQRRIIPLPNGVSQYLMMQVNAFCPPTCRWPKVIQWKLTCDFIPRDPFVGPQILSILFSHCSYLSVPLSHPELQLHIGCLPASSVLVMLNRPTRYLTAF